MKHFQLVKLIGLFALCVSILTACVGGASLPTRFYVLSPMDVTTPAPGLILPKGTTIGVGPINIPAHLNRPQIVTHSSNNQLKLADFDQWAEPLNENISRVVVENLSNLMQSERIYSFANTSRLSDDGYQLVIDITRFEQSNSGVVYLDAKWMLYKGLEREPKLLRTARYKHDRLVGSVEEMAAALSDRIGELSIDIAGSLASIN